MSPEAFLDVPENGASVDLFGAAVTLFMMIAGHNPFEAAICKDPHYNLLMRNQNDTFWAIHEAMIAHGNTNDQDTFFSEDFRSLINAMFSLDPNLRLSLAEVKAHPWLKGDVATYEEICEEFSLRKKVMRAIIYTSYLAKQKEK